MRASFLDVGAIQCAGFSALIAQRAHGMRVDDVIVLLISGGLLVGGAVLLIWGGDGAIGNPVILGVQPFSSA